MAKLKRLVILLFGIGFAIAMTAAVKNASKYYPSKAGLINALAGGFGGNLGSSFFNLVIKFFVSKGDFPNNQDNNMYKKTTAENYKIFFYIHGGVVLGISIISALLLVPYEENKKTSETIENKSENLVKEVDKVENNNENYKSGLKIILTHSRIYLLLFIFLFTSFLQGFIFTVGFNYGTMAHGDDIQSEIGGDEMSIIFMLTSLISSFMGPLFGFIYDKIGFKITLILIDGISILNGLLISLTVRWGVAFYGISIILNGCLNGGAFSMIFPYVGKIYGFNYAGELYGFVVLSTGISSIASASIYYVMSQFSSDKSNNDGTYLIIFICGAVLNLMAIILTFFESNEPFDFNHNNQNDNESKKLLTNSTKEELESKVE